MSIPKGPFKKLFFVDSEFRPVDGEMPTPVCLVARELISGEVIQIWQDDLLKMKECPFDLGPESLYVSYFATAELSCHAALGWRFPHALVDLYNEFRCMTNGVVLEHGRSLLGALNYYGLPAIESAQKDAFRELIITNDNWSKEKKEGILKYCKSDVDSLVDLFERMSPNIHMQRALFRGEFTKALAKVECRGTPLDLELLERLEIKGPEIKTRLMERVNEIYPIFENGVFKAARLKEYIDSRGLHWPMHSTGNLCFDDDTFKVMANVYGHPFNLFREARAIISKMKDSKLSVGSDGRNRCMLSPFRSVTGRNQPSTTKYIFGQPSFKRSAIKAPEELALAVIDWRQQEVGIGAGLSGDEAMKLAYSSGDPYLTFAAQAGAVPANATKESHKRERDQFKECMLGVLFGMGARGLSIRINQPLYVAEGLLNLHHRAYPKFWAWSEAAVDKAMIEGSLQTVFGWPIKVTSSDSDQINPRRLQNFPMQANASEMMRLAMIYADRMNIEICAPIHDAFLIQAPVNEIDKKVLEMQEIMRIASMDVLDGFELRSEAKILLPGERYHDPRGDLIWREISDLVPIDHPCAPATELSHQTPPGQSIISSIYQEPLHG